MPMRFHIHSPEDLLDGLKRLDQGATAQLPKLTAQKKIAYQRGYIDGLANAIFYVEEHLKTLYEDAATALRDGQPDMAE